MIFFGCGPSFGNFKLKPPKIHLDGNAESCFFQSMKGCATNTTLNFLWHVDHRAVGIGGDVCHGACWHWWVWPAPQQSASPATSLPPGSRMLLEHIGPRPHTQSMHPQLHPHSLNHVTILSAMLCYIWKNICKNIHFPSSPERCEGRIYGPGNCSIKSWES